MTDPLARVEEELLQASRRYVARGRVRQRVALAAAVVAALLAAASVASGISGVGPVGSIFASDEFAPPHARPAPGGRRALLTASGPGGQRWDLLVYRARRSVTRQPTVRDYCLAVARRGARPVPRGVRRPSRRRVPGYGFDSISCEYPPTLAARIVRRRIEAREAPATVPTDETSRTHALYGLALAGVRSVSVRQGTGPPVKAKVSRTFRLEIPRLPPRVRRQIESRSQRQRTRRLPKFVMVRAYLAVVGPQTQPTTLRVAAKFARGRTRIVRLRSRPAPQRVTGPAPVTPDTKPPAGRPQVRLDVAGPGGARWTMRGFETRDRTTCIVASAPGRTPVPGESAACAGWAETALPIARSGVWANRPDTVLSPGSYPVYGLARGDVREVTVIDPRGRRWRAQLSGVWNTLVRPRDYLRDAGGGFARRLRRLPRSLRLRAFLVVVPSPPGPASGKGLAFRVKLTDGRTLKAR